MTHPASSDDENKKRVMELTSFFLHKHYCENDWEPIISHLDDDVVVIGAGEYEYVVGTTQVLERLRSFHDRIPPCRIYDEHYDVLQPAKDLFICTGTLWISTDPASRTFLRVHQRITAVFRMTAEGLRCCHIHLSNPYMEMEDNEVGFPEKMSLESRRYFQEQIEVQRKKIEKQHDLIVQIYFEDLSTGLYNRNRFNKVCESLRGRECGRLGVAYFDLNGLKQVNDVLGHQAGDELLCRTAAFLRRGFEKKAYRIGGDEFIVIDAVSGEKNFLDNVHAVCSDIQDDGISVSCGASWRPHGNIDEQIHEADRNMYNAKQNFYARRENNRRKR